MKKMIIAALAALTLIMTAPAPAEANMISDAASTVVNTANDAAGSIQDGISSATTWTLESLMDACNKLGKACDKLITLSTEALETILDTCKSFELCADLLTLPGTLIEKILGSCHKLNACDWMLTGTTDELTALMNWLDENPAITLGLQTSMILFPALLAGDILPSGPLGPTIRGALAAGDKGTAGTKIALAWKALLNKTISLCEEASCRLPKAAQTVRKWTGNGWPKEILEALAKKHGMTLEELRAAIADGTLAIDHILPLSCGGTNNISNLQLLTAAANATKGDFSSCTKIPARILWKHGR